MQHPSDCPTPADASSRKPPDVALLTRRMVEGDETAYRIFYDVYFDRLSRYLLVVAGGDEGAARDALQSTLVRVVRHIKVFPDDRTLWSWLAVLARSALRDQSRKHRRYLAFLDRFTQHARAEHEVSGSRDADATLLEALGRVLAKLPSEERELVERKYFSRETVRDIAQALRITEKAVESRLARMRQKLKEALLAELKDERTD